MKNLLTTLLLLITSFTFSQKTETGDSTKICFPYQVGQKILLDLNECDKNKELLDVTKKEIKLLNQKVSEKDSIISDLEKEVEICDTIIEKTKEKFEIVDEENKNLRDDIKKLKVKNTIFNIVGGAIIGGLTYFVVFK